ncbi:MAG: hypothetical protein FWG70_10535 [Oscillospiraceae bacterium]|nr:hypothetical protein [Oscillospiraceae bacterium]
MKKTKKSLIIILLIIVLPVILYISLGHIVSYFAYRYKHDYTDWQNVSVERIGTFKVPIDWIVTLRDDIIYITDKGIDVDGYKTYLVGSIYLASWENADMLKQLYDAEYIRTVESRINSYGSTYGMHEFRINGDYQTKNFICMAADSENGVIDIVLYAWDDLVDKDMIIKIAESYRTEHLLRKKPWFLQR